MASRKTELKKHLDYLEARRSGAEYCLNIVKVEADQALIRSFVQSLNKSIMKTSVEIAMIEKHEAEVIAKLEAERDRRRREANDE